jgi:hypothetical protein
MLAKAHPLFLFPFVLFQMHCSSEPYRVFNADVAAAKLTPNGVDMRPAQAKFCAAAAQDFDTRAQFNQNWHIGITGFGAVATAAGSGASLVAAQMADGSAHRRDVLEGGAIATAAGLAALALSAIFDWNGLSKQQRVASASMAESSARILEAPQGSQEEKDWFDRCASSAVKLGEGIPSISPPLPSRDTGDPNPH